MADRRVKLTDTGRYSFVDPSVHGSGTRRSVRPLSVLVVEDDAAVAACIVDVLADAGHACVHVPSIAAARRHLASKLPDVVTLDLEIDDELPTMLIGEVSRMPRSPAIVIVSASRLTQQIAAEHRLSFLRKPFAIADLTRLVEDAARGRSGSP